VSDTHEPFKAPPTASPRFAGGFIPNLVIAGAPKCGTSSLHRWLAAHPDVIGSSKKETYFLSDPGTHMFRPQASVLGGLAGYTRYFEADTGQNPVAVLESTPSYIYSATALRVLPGLPSRPRVVFVLREPSAQVYSIFGYFQSNWNWIPPEMTFREFVDRALAGNPQEYRGNELAQNAVQNARYVDFLRRWRDALGGDRMRIYLFENLRTDPRTLVKDVATFAGLDPGFFEDFAFQAFNQTVAVRSRVVQNLNIAVRALLPKGRFYDAGRRLYRRVNTKAPAAKTELDIETLVQLKSYFQESNQRLSGEFGLDLSSWG
jgi:hypothetical protein